MLHVCDDVLKLLAKGIESVRNASNLTNGLYVYALLKVSLTPCHLVSKINNASAYLLERPYGLVGYKGSYYSYNNSHKEACKNNRVECGVEILVYGGKWTESRNRIACLMVFNGFGKIHITVYLYPLLLLVRSKKLFQTGNVHFFYVLKVVFRKVRVSKDSSIVFSHNKETTCPKVYHVENLGKGLQGNFYRSVAYKIIVAVINAPCNTNNRCANRRRKGIGNHNFSRTAARLFVPAPLSRIVATVHGTVKVGGIAAPFCSKVNLRNILVRSGKTLAKGPNPLFRMALLVFQNMNRTAFVHKRMN